VRRRDQNQARKDWDDLKDVIAELDPMITEVLLRASQLPRRKRMPDGSPEVGTPSPPWSDPTGEEAVSQSQHHDSVEMSINTLTNMLRRALNTAKVIKAITPADVRDRASRSIPECLACGDPCFGGVRNGFDEKCGRRWDRAGRPDRGEFIAMVKRERDKGVSHASD